MPLSRDVWPRLKEAFEGARALAVDARPAYLAEACRGDEALRREVERLLAHSDRAASFLETPMALDDDLVATCLEGQCIGSYQVAALIGTGGMGAVYRARDTTLNRLVAIKVLMPALATDPDRLARFSREAQILASLNHPHIAQVHGFEQAGGVHALVMELVEGPTLADRIAQGALPVDEALALATQIAEALEAAHEQGIVHRDLKPANIKVRADGRVKVLDFGLAKALDAPRREGGEAGRAPAPGVRETGAGVIAGTAAYMSPEQARGLPVDRRTDLWAFGAVLYEMLTTRLAFPGETASDTIVAILEREPDWQALPAGVPVPVRTLLRRLLAKDRRRRLDSASDARLEIDDAVTFPAAGTLAGAPTSRRLTPAAIAALAGVAAIAALAAGILLRPASAVPMPARFAIAPAPGLPLNVSGFARDLAVSSDGRHLVYRAGGTNTFGSPLMVRALDRLDAQRLADVNRALAPFFSPDNRWIGFFENTDLKKVPIAGGPAITLGQFSGTPLGASWGDDNTITFATDGPGNGLWRVPADGGEPTMVTRAGPGEQERPYSFPSVLPLGRGILFTMAAASQADSAIAVLDLTTGRHKTLIHGGSDAQYVETGHLMFAAAGALRAVRFDPVRLEVLGDPVTVVDRVMMKPNGAANYTVSRAGTLAYISPGVSEMTAPRALLWVDRKGREEPTGAPLRAYGTPRLSPDGTHVAAEIYDQNTDVWIWSFAQQTLRRLTFDPAGDGMAVWTPDGRRIIFQSGRAGVSSVYTQAADGTGPVERLSPGDVPQWSTSITPDGTWVAGFDRAPRTPSGNVIFLPLTRAAVRPRANPAPGINPLPPDPIFETSFQGAMADFSPNGRHIVYQSDESGRSEIYIRPFPHVRNGRWQVSTAGGTRPVWARNGRELFYLDLSNALTAVPVGMAGPSISIGSPTKLFDTPYLEPNPSRHYDVAADGQRFLMLKASAPGDPDATPASMVVVLNWLEELTRPAPAR